MLNMKNGTKIIVTSIYELNYENLRGIGVYKNFELLTETIRSLIFDDYKYIIFTNEFTLKKYDLLNIFNKSNIEIRIKELNSNLYLNKINPIRVERFNDGDIYDRIYSVKNYIEVILNKISNLLEISNEINEGSVIWLDSGLFGTSCHDAWRDYLKNEIVYKKEFLNKIFEKIDINNFIATKGNEILINYELKDKIKDFCGFDIKIIPGCLFGGKKNFVINILNNYIETYISFIEKYKILISEQELLSILTNEKNVKFFEFDDWLDLQKVFLQIMDLYDESKYLTNNIINYKKNVNNVTKPKSIINYNSFTELADLIGIDKGSKYENHRYTEIYEKYLDKFKYNEITMIEIGICDPRFCGKSIKFWEILFPKLKYYGIDILDLSNLEYNKDKITLINCDQNNEIEIKLFIENYNLNDKLDVIIDDGSHESEHILTSFKTLFKYLKIGGYYFIEDLHASWALRDITIREIEIFLNENFKNNYNINYFGQKLMLITKL